MRTNKLPKIDDVLLYDHEKIVVTKILGDKDKVFFTATSIEFGFEYDLSIYAEYEFISGYIWHTVEEAKSALAADKSKQDEDCDNKYPTRWRTVCIGVYDDDKDTLCEDPEREWFPKGIQKKIIKNYIDRAKVAGLKNFTIFAESMMEYAEDWPSYFAGELEPTDTWASINLYRNVESK